MKTLRVRAVAPALLAVGLTACVEEAPTVGAPLAPSFSTAAVSSTPMAEPGRYLVMFQGDDVPADFSTTVRGVQASAAVAHRFDGMGVAVVTGLDAAGADRLARARGVVAVEPDYEIELETPVTGDVEPVVDGMHSPENPATASFFPRQWHLQTINAPAAWAAGRLGSRNITVAILDTGIDDTYPDLAGLVDLSRSRDMLDPALYADQEIINTMFPGRPATSDLQFHGTHVAATASSNAIVAAGVTSRTTLLAVKVCGVRRTPTLRVPVPNNAPITVNCATSGVLAGIRHAADVGAHVANMSLGGGFAKAGAEGFAGRFINRAVTYAFRKGTLLVVSAGNSRWNLDQNLIPQADGSFARVPSLYASYCNAPGVVCVSATGPTGRATVNGPWTDIDAPASYTNFGRSAISVGAPGGNGVSTVTAGCTRTTVWPNLTPCRTGTFVIGLNGTSMAAPHVSGLAALIAEDVGRNPGRIRAILQSSGDDLGETGTDPFYGKGRINVRTALGL